MTEDKIDDYATAQEKIKRGVSPYYGKPKWLDGVDLPTLPVIGRHYRSKDGELAKVVSIAGLRRVEDRSDSLPEAPVYVILRHSPLTWLGRTHRSEDTAIPASEWARYEFKEITLNEYLERGSRSWRGREQWALVVLSKKELTAEGRPMNSSCVAIVKATGAFKPGEAAKEDKRRAAIPKSQARLVFHHEALDTGDVGDEIEFVECAHGSRTLRRAPLDGKVYRYREDARRAKDRLCVERKIPRTSSNDHYGYDGSY